jgi:ATP-dependent Lon protease
MPDVIREDTAFLDRIHFYIPGWEIPKMQTAMFTSGYGFVVDYLAEALRQLRKRNYTELLDHHFSLGSQLKSRDVKAARKSVAGLIKLIYPHGEVSRDELRELLELALEGRRRVKEQLKKMGSFEFFQTSFSYIDKETGEERYVGVPEEGGRNMISADPLEPGSVYTASVDDEGKVGLYRLEVGCSGGTGNSGRAKAASPRKATSFPIRFYPSMRLWWTPWNSWSSSPNKSWSTVGYTRRRGQPRKRLKS